VAPRQGSRASWEMEIQVDWDENEAETYHIFATPTDVDQLLEGPDWNYMRPEDVAQAKASRWGLGVETTYSEAPLIQFHRQLQLLHAIAPEAVAVIDDAACWPHPGAWMEEIATTMAPPNPLNLYLIHEVFEEGDREVWIHTHGLLRCGCLELEMLGVPTDAVGPLGGLLTTAAAMVIEQAMPPADEPFLIGADMDLVWLPWEQGIRQFPRGTPGARDSDRDDFHSIPSAVLLAPGRKLLGLFGRRYRNPLCYRPLLDGNPLLFVSNLETLRMSMLAQERLDVFLELLARFTGSKDWLFMVKIGYPVDEAQDEDDREHLWFEVHGADAESVDATLTNQPYAITRMREGDRARHSLDGMSDWNIFCEYGRFDPDTVVHLIRELEARDA